MGASYVVAALPWGRHLSDQAFRVLMKMAVTVLDNATDEQPAGEFFGNVSDIADIMRGSGSRETKTREVRRGVEDLMAIGAIVAMRKPRKGVRQRYRLTVLDPSVRVPEVWEPEKKKRRGKGGIWTPAEKKADETQGHSTPNTEGHSTPNTEGHSTPNVRGAVPTLRNQQEPPQELLQENMAGVVDGDPSTVAPEEASENPEDLVSPSTTDNSNPTNTVVKEAGPPTTREIAPCGDETCIGGVRKLTEAPWIAYCPTCRPAPVPALDA